jgi:lipopolysaccharide/colanic/teichoic acid biosynthesis glycosyltransferase
MAVLAAIIRVTMGAPVLFQQDRPGRNGEVFRVHKFRTMNGRTDAQGDLLPDRERLTRMGKLLRATSLDELPQLWNVLVGEMSLVGPRPLLVQYLERYSPRQARRHDVKPGITGWAQVNGRNAITWDKRLEMDVWYVENWSLLLDLRILLLTLKKVIVRDGISAPGEATVSEFMGAQES